MGISQTEIVYTLALQQIPGIGSLLGRKLIERLGSAEAVFRTPAARLESTPGIGPLLAQAIKQHQDISAAESEWQKAEKHGIRLLHFKDVDFPARLKQCPDHPLLLFGKGHLPLNTNRVVAVVGTRGASDYGRLLVEQLVRGLLPYNVLVLSGLAYGIDIHAHRQALAAGLPTVAVLGHGLSRIYPAAHKHTAEKMLETGGLLTECWYDSPPDRENFPKRNRIVAGMADAVVVVEAAENGGALITATIANDYNRDVYAFPGRITDPGHAGCHKLVMQNKAALIGSPADLITAMGWGGLQEETKAGRQGLLFLDLEPDEQRLFDLMPFNQNIGIDELIVLTGWSTSRLSHLLLALEFKGAVRAAPGKLFSRQ